MTDQEHKQINDMMKVFGVTAIRILRDTAEAVIDSSEIEMTPIERKELINKLTKMPWDE